MLAKIVNISKNSLKRHNFLVMAEKALLRFKEKDYQKASPEVLAWCQKYAEPYDVLLNTLDSTLWQETIQVCTELDTQGRAKLDALGLDLGGGGNYPLLYFFTRYLSAQTVVETGVAAGWSSQAILKALQKNGNNGHLYSSDFPYFRYEEPEKLIGYVVDEELKQNWTLYIEGDKFNLPDIMDDVGEIDLFHYDSDKSMSGREYAINLVEPKLSKKAVVIFDDIQDNFHFRDYVLAKRLEFKVFEFGGKYIGLTGGLT